MPLAASQLHHWTARGLLDRNRALWCGFVLRGLGDGVFFAGDTGFDEGRPFRRVAERHGALGLALLPIGAYEPRWFMASQHLPVPPPSGQAAAPPGQTCPGLAATNRSGSAPSPASAAARSAGGHSTPSPVHGRMPEQDTQGLPGAAPARPGFGRSGRRSEAGRLRDAEPAAQRVPQIHGGFGYMAEYPIGRA
jgi:hypothetical protein